MGDMGNDIGDMADMDNNMEVILPREICRDIVEIRDIDIMHGDTSITIR